jgi:D-3-phosphoglycerate dehydrogenase
MTHVYFFDFDSTLIDCEALDLLAQIKNDTTSTNQIQELTAKAMNGAYSFEKSLKERIDILSPTIEEINYLKKELLLHITPSIVRNKDFFEQYKSSIYIVSGGFVEYIKPVAMSLGILEHHIFGNRFLVEGDSIIGVDDSNPLSRDQGKSKVIESISPTSYKIMIGDGYTDYEVFLNNKVDHFVAFAENIDRPIFDQIQNIDKVHSLDAFLAKNNL